ncbi:MAG: type II secretion system protein [Kiritimatiellaeota bacterium]|nr:type II secretion system protein [Kiritimatiellota bacterium]
MYTHRFTLIEMLVVLAIMGLVSALVIPRVGRLPAGIAIRRTVAQVRNAFRMAAVRARGTGRAVRLEFAPDAHALRLSDLPRSRFSTDARLTPPSFPAASGDAGTSSADGIGENGTGSAGLLAALSAFPLPKGVEWRSDNAPAGGDGDETVEFRFFPNGEASGPDLVVIAGKRRVRLTLERLTGRLRATEEETTP